MLSLIPAEIFAVFTLCYYPETQDQLAQPKPLCTGVEQLGFSQAGSKDDPTATAGADSCFTALFSLQLGQVISSSGTLLENTSSSKSWLHERHL